MWTSIIYLHDMRNQILAPLKGTRFHSGSLYDCHFLVQFQVPKSLLLSKSLKAPSNESVTPQKQKWFENWFCRSSHLKVFRQKVVLKNFANFTGNYLCLNLFFKKVSHLRPHKCFPMSFSRNLRTAFCIEQLWWLLLVLEVMK